MLIRKPQILVLLVVLLEALLVLKLPGLLSIVYGNPTAVLLCSRKNVTQQHTTRMYYIYIYMYTYMYDVSTMDYLSAALMLKRR